MTATAQTTISLDAPQDVTAKILSHLRDDHGMAFRTKADRHVFEQDGYRIEFALHAQALDVRLQAPNDNAMQFSKEGLVHHIAAIDPALAETIRWQGVAQKAGVAPSNFRLLTVRRSTLLFEGMQRVTLHYPDIDKLAAQGLHLRLVLPCDPTRRPVWPVMGANGAPVWPKGADALHARYVTLKNIRPEREEVDIDVVRHGAGLISRWAQEARAGQKIGAMGPVGLSALPQASSYFIAADGTGLPIVAQLLAKLPQDTKGDVVLALPDSLRAEDYLPPSRLRLHRLTPNTFDDSVLDVARELTNPGVGYGFFAGEFATAKALRDHFKGPLGLGKGQQMSTAYWRR
ncbi:siderophore-interacting protein [Sulfitobacter sp. S0837]|uniref:siderophore-interacting protein n=1 Tax=Sulfitobacter maritimus TaxID=2741719 RepID=UPI0015827D07|nr:siderophore-interacting protein [Sulfitobacter maritimus]NUH67137.1 siderophore-interacting protein [Sulfitobacter maritimus]